MEIIDIFAVPEEDSSTALYSVQWDEYGETEFERVLDQIADREWLDSFFSENSRDLPEDISREELLFSVSQEARRLRRNCELLAKGKDGPDFNSFPEMFKPLSESRDKGEFTKRTKAKVGEWRFTRLYAIEIDGGSYVITGGAIKLTQTMQERSHTENERIKLDIAEAYIHEQGFFP